MKAIYKCCGQIESINYRIDNLKDEVIVNFLKAYLDLEEDDACYEDFEEVELKFCPFCGKKLQIIQI